MKIFRFMKDLQMLDC